jgi:hypothetical protein
MARKDRELAELVTPGRLDKPIIVLRKVNTGPLSVKPNRNAPSVMERIGMGYIEQAVEEKETTWFGQGYIINDQPRMAGITEEILANTEGFAIANSRTGQILKEGGPGSLRQMQALADGAEVTINVGVSGLDDLEADESEDEDAELEAPTAKAKSSR